jgi:hypothetical protein
MTNFADEYPGEKLTVHISRAATVTARMPTPEECAAGSPPDAPVLVVDSGAPTGSKVFPHLVALAFGDPHAQAAPDQVRDAALYVLGIIGQDLSLTNARIDELMCTLRTAPPDVARLADEVRAEQAAAFRCADLTTCQRTT